MDILYMGKRGVEGYEEFVIRIIKFTGKKPFVKCGEEWFGDLGRGSIENCQTTNEHTSSKS
jgi:hypothetical protein